MTQSIIVATNSLHFSPLTYVNKIIKNYILAIMREYTKYTETSILLASCSAIYTNVLTLLLIYGQFEYLTEN